MLGGAGGGVTLGSLLYFIRMKNDEFKKGVADTEKSLNNMDKKFEDSKKKLKIVGTAITGISAGVVFALKRFTDQTAQDAEKIDKFRKETGIAAETISELGYVAAQELSSLDELGAGLTRLTRRMGEARSGNETYAKSFREMGIDVNDMALTVDEAFLQIADRFARVEDETKKVEWAFNLFERSGYSLIPVLSLGREGIMELADEARRLGIVLTQENIAKFREYKDTMDAWQAGMSGVRMSLATEALPVFLKVAQGLKSMVEWVNQLPPALREVTVNSGLAASGLGLIVGPMLLIIAYIPKIKAGLAAMGLAFKPFLVGGAIIIGLTAIVTLFKEMRENARLARMEVEEMEKSELERERDRLQKEIAELEKDKAGYEEIGAQWQPIHEEYLRQYKERLKEINEQLAKKNQAEKEAESAAEQSRRQAEILDELENQLRITTETAETFGEENELNAQKTGLYRQAIEDLITEGLDPTQTRMGNLVKLYWEYAEAAELDTQETYDFGKAVKDLRASLEQVDKQAEVFGDEIDVNAEKAQTLRAAIVDMILNGMDPQSKAVQDLIDEYQHYSDEVEKANDALKLQTETTGLLAQAQAELDRWNNRELDSLEILAQKLEAQAELDKERADELRRKAALLRETIKLQEDEADAEAVSAKTTELLTQAAQAQVNEEQRHLSALERLALQLEAQAVIDKERRDELLAQAAALRELNQELKEQGNQEIALNKLAAAQRRLAEMTGTALPAWEQFAQELEEAAAADGVLPEVAAQLREIADLIRQAGDEEEDTKTNWFVEMFEDIGIKIEDVQGIFETFRDSVIDGFTDIIMKGKDVGDVFKRILDYMAEVIVKKAIIEPLVESVIGGGGSAHTGAMVAPHGLVRDLPDYHTGGLIRPDERIIKVLTGERILSRSQNEKFEAGEYGKTEITNIFDIKAVDAASFAQLVRRNPEVITSVVSGDIVSDGQLRQVIKRYSK